MRARTVLVGLLALTFGVSAAWGVYLFSAPPLQTSVDKTTIIVALASIPRGSNISRSLVQQREWPAELVPKDALTRLEDVVDRTVAVPMVKDDLVLEGKLAPKGAGRGMAALIPPGMRAFTIQTPNVSTGVAGFILPGNRVDVLLTVNGASGGEGSRGSRTTTLLQHVEVLAVNQLIDAPHENRMDLKELRSVTLLVSPADARKLDLGQNMGSLQLVLRNPDDNAVEQIAPANAPGTVPATDEVADSNDAAMPAMPERLSRQIRTLRGSRSGTVYLLEQPSGRPEADATNDAPRGPAKSR
jgi:pilus assembly protein CpaB